MTHAALTAALIAELDVHPLVAAVLIERGCASVAEARAFLDPLFFTPTPPEALPGIAEAAAQLQLAIANNALIRIWGDFDVDGQTATSVLLLGLRQLGARVDFTIPDRATHNHGLNREGISRAKADGVSVLLTCDCGVTDFDEIAHARTLGLIVIVSDHHDLSHDDAGQLRLPDAHAVVNPKRLPQTHTLANLPGVGVAYKLIEALAPNGQAPEDLLALVALGIVADVAVQRGDTRYLLQRGLAHLRATQRPGVLALFRQAALSASDLSAESIAFQLGPRLNAAGRLASAELSVHLLTTDSALEAEALAQQIEDLNSRRRELQKEIETEAAAMIDARPEIAESAVIVLHNTGWHLSVIGIVASGLVDRYQRPAIVISESSGPGGLGRASARSIDGIDIHSAIAAQGKLTIGGGGHPMAAGFSIRSENIASFIQGVSAHVARQHQTPAASKAQLEAFPVAWAEAARADRALLLARAIERLAPFGAGNPRPLLHSAPLYVVRAEPLGKERTRGHQALYLRDEAGTPGRALWWRSAHLRQPDEGSPIRLHYRVRLDIYRDLPRAQLDVVTLETYVNTQAQPAEPGSTPGVITADLPKATAAAAFMIEDHRRQSTLIDTTQSADGVLTWPVDAPDRHAPVLCFAAEPAGPDITCEILLRVRPRRVILLPMPAPSDAADTSEALLGIARRLEQTAQQRGDALDDPHVLQRMARRVNQRSETLAAAFDFLHGQDDASKRLDYLLQETRGYRKFFREAPADEVLRLSDESDAER